MYLAIFTQFFCDFHTVFCASHKSERTSCIFIFFKDKFIFSRMILQNSRTKGTFFKFQDQGQIFQVCPNPVRACLILYATLTPKFNLWIYVVVMECRSLFSSTVTMISEVSSWKMHPQQIAYFIYGSIPYLVCRYISGPGESSTVSRSLWPWPLISVLARSSSGHIWI